MTERSVFLLYSVYSIKLAMRRSVQKFEPTVHSALTCTLSAVLKTLLTRFPFVQRRRDGNWIVKLTLYKTLHVLKSTRNMDEGCGILLPRQNNLKENNDKV